MVVSRPSAQANHPFAPPAAAGGELPAPFSCTVDKKSERQEKRVDTKKILKIDETNRRMC